MAHQPLLVVLSGPSGVGKDSVIQQLRAEVPELRYAVTATTRPPRPGERDGVNYDFVSQAEYDKMLRLGELLAPAQVHGYWYGAPLARLRDQLASGADVLLKIDVQGAVQVRRKVGHAVFVFLAPPSLEDLAARLRARDTETGAEVRRRMDDAEFEMTQQTIYDYLVTNGPDGVREAAHDVACIVRAERLRARREPVQL